MARWRLIAVPSKRYRFIYERIENGFKIVSDWVLLKKLIARYGNIACFDMQLLIADIINNTRHIHVKFYMMDD